SADRARDGAHRVHTQAEEPRAGAVPLAARIPRVSSPCLYAVRVADGTHAAVRDRAAHRSHDRGPSRMIGFNMEGRRLLAGAALLLATQLCVAQQSQNDVQSLLLGRNAAGDVPQTRADTLLESRPEAEAQAADREPMT